MGRGTTQDISQKLHDSPISNLQPLVFSKKKKQLSFQETPILNFPIRCHRVATWIFSQQCPHHWIPTSSDECQKWLTGTRQYATFVKPVAFELKTSRQRKKSRAVTATVKYHANCDIYLGANFEWSGEDQTTCRLVDPWLYECVANFGTLIHLILQPPKRTKIQKYTGTRASPGKEKWYTNHLSKCCSCQFSPLPNNPRKPQVCNFSYNPPHTIHIWYIYLHSVDFLWDLAVGNYTIPMDAGMRTAKNCKKKNNLAWLCAPKRPPFFWMNCSYLFIFAWIGWIWGSGWWFQSIWRKICQKTKLDHLPR